MKNSKYWSDRMVQIELNALEKGEAYYENLKKQYDIAIKNINLDITNWYERLAKNNDISLLEAKKLLDKNELKEFKWTLEEYIEYGETNAMNQQWLKELENASAKYHINRLEAMQIQMKQHLEKLANEQNKEMTKTLSNIYEDTYYHTAFEIAKGVGIATSLEKIDTRRIEKILSTGWATDGKNFSDRIWSNKEKLVSTLNTELTQMFIRGEAPDRAIKALSAKMNVNKKQAGRLVMTESAMIASSSQKDCYKDLGLEEFEVVATLDMTTCEVCGSLDGIHLPMKNYEIGKTAPPFHANCRCCTAPYFADDEGTRIARGEDGKTYYIDNNIKYQDWKKQFVDNSNKNQSTSSKKSDIIRKNENKDGNKLPYLDITNEMYNNSKPYKGTVKKQNYFEDNGEKYIIDGHNVVYKHDDRELEVANLLNKTFGGNVRILPNINFPQGVKSPDYIYRGERTDLKRITSKRPDALKTALRNKEKQATNFIIDNTAQTLDDKEIIRQIDEIYNLKGFLWVDKIYLLKDKNFIKVFKRI